MATYTEGVVFFQCRGRDKPGPADHDQCKKSNRSNDRPAFAARRLWSLRSLGGGRLRLHSHVAEIVMRWIALVPLGAESPKTPLASFDCMNPVSSVARTPMV